MEIEKKLKDLCVEYISSKPAEELINRFLRVFNDPAFSPAEKKIVITTLLLLKHEILHAYHKAYVKCVDRVNSIINELEVEAQRDRD